MHSLQRNIWIDKARQGETKQEKNVQKKHYCRVKHNERAKRKTKEPKKTLPFSSGSFHNFVFVFFVRVYGAPLVTIIDFHSCTAVQTFIYFFSTAYLLVLYCCVNKYWKEQNKKPDFLLVDFHSVRGKQEKSSSSTTLSHKHHPCCVYVYVPFAEPHFRNSLSFRSFLFLLVPRQANNAGLW